MGYTSDNGGIPWDEAPHYHIRARDRIYGSLLVGLIGVYVQADRDAVVAAAHRAQADVLEIEALAKRRLADEYDAAQARGEVSAKGQRGSHVPDKNMRATAADVGLTRKQIHGARQIRDVEERDLGIKGPSTRRSLALNPTPPRA